MITIDENLFLKSVLFFLTLCGYNPFEKINVFQIMNKVIHLSCNVTFFVLVILYIYFNINETNIDTVSEIITAFITSSHVLVKAFTFAMYKSNIKELLTGTYWKMEDVNVELQKSNADIFKSVKTIGIAFLIGVAISIVVYASIAYPKEIFLCYIPNKYFLTRKFVFYVQFIYLLYGTTIAMTFECIFMYLCYKHLTQYQIISYKIENITTYDDPHLEINKCIEHHCYMLRMFNKLSITYETFFLCEYMVCLLTNSSNLYQISETSSNGIQSLKAIIYTITILVQFVGCNCYFAELLAQNMAGVGIAAYNSKWYDGDLKLAHKMLVILQNAQMNRYIKAGGFADINLAVLTNLFKSTLSIVTFLQTLKSK